MKKLKMNQKKKKNLKEKKKRKIKSMIIKMN